jgi:hypothetical protein
LKLVCAETWGRISAKCSAAARALASFFSAILRYSAASCQTVIVQLADDLQKFVVLLGFLRMLEKGSHDPDVA